MERTRYVIDTTGALNEWQQEILERENIEAVADKAQQRKATPIYSGVIKYFPNAIAEVAKCSQAGNDQHHPDKPLHWDMSKSSDELDALVRHLTDHSVDPVDDDGVFHLAKVAWRALAALERFKRGEEI
jgi:hypothetical protein